MTKKDKFIKAAIEIAKLSDNRARVGCIAVYKNKIIGIGHNSNKTHPLQYKYNSYRHFLGDNNIIHAQHAEINCISHILNLDVDFSKVILYVVRILKNDSLALAKPCLACYQCIKEIGILKIFYSTDSEIKKLT